MHKQNDNYSKNKERFSKTKVKMRKFYNFAKFSEKYVLKKIESDWVKIKISLIF